VKDYYLCFVTPGGRLRRPAASSGVRREGCVGERLRRKFIMHFTNTEKKPFLWRGRRRFGRLSQSENKFPNFLSNHEFLLKRWPHLLPASWTTLIATAPSSPSPSRPRATLLRQGRERRQPAAAAAAAAAAAWLARRDLEMGESPCITSSSAVSSSSAMPPLRGAAAVERADAASRAAAARLSRHSLNGAIRCAAVSLAASVERSRSTGQAQAQAQARRAPLLLVEVELQQELRLIELHASLLHAAPPNTRQADVELA